MFTSFDNSSRDDARGVIHLIFRTYRRVCVFWGFFRQVGTAWQPVLVRCGRTQTPSHHPTLRFSLKTTTNLILYFIKYKKECFSGCVLVYDFFSATGIISSYVTFYGSVSSKWTQQGVQPQRRCIALKICPLLDRYRWPANGGLLTSLLTSLIRSWMCFWSDIAAGFSVETTADNVAAAVGRELASWVRLYLRCVC